MGSGLRRRSYLFEEAMDFRKAKSELDRIGQDLKDAKVQLDKLSRGDAGKSTDEFVDAIKRIWAAALYAARAVGTRIR